MRTAPGIRRVLAAWLFSAVAALALSAAPQQRVGETVTAMSFNIRYGTAKDGDNAWERRRAMVFDVIRNQDADLVGLQEALDFQIEEILAAAPSYASIGVGRDDGAARGELSAILFRKNRYRIAESGTFWFTDSPATPGSKSWGNNITRICTWARLMFTPTPEIPPECVYQAGVPFGHPKAKAA